MITDLVDYLNNNLLIAHYCGFDISAPLPSYWTFDRFLKISIMNSLYNHENSGVVSFQRRYCRHFFYWLRFNPCLCKYFTE